MKTTFHIESYRNGRLIDINETEFATKELAGAEIMEWKKWDTIFKRVVVADFLNELKVSVFDEDNSDRIPSAPTFPNFEYKVAEYIHTINGFFTRGEYPESVKIQEVINALTNNMGIVSTDEFIRIAENCNLTKSMAVDVLWYYSTMSDKLKGWVGFDWQDWIKRIVF